MGIIVLWILTFLVVVSGIFIIYIKKVPHGWVQFKTGLVLKFLPPLDRLPVVQLRTSMEDYINKKLPEIKKALPVEYCEDIDIPTRHGSIRGRIFKNGDANADHLIVLVHGGGWCVGSVNTYEEVSRRLVRETGLPLISLDYSLAPEHKFPHAHEECLDAITWISNHPHEITDHEVPLVLIGDSAGGNLIIASMYDCQNDVRKKVKKLAAIYPAADSRKSDYPSSRKYRHGYYLTGKAIAQFTEAIITSKEDVKDIRLSPLYNDPVPDFPDTFVLTAEYDPIRDQGEAFADKLRSEGAAVIQKRYPDTVHAFFGLKDFGSRGLEAVADIGSFIRNEPVNGSR